MIARRAAAVLGLVFVAGAGAAREVVVAPGETLWIIAERELGDGHRWHEILEANPGVVPSRLNIGQVLVIPEAGAPPPGMAPVPVRGTDGSRRALAGAERARAAGTIRAAKEAGAPEDLVADAAGRLDRGEIAEARRLAEAAAAAAGVRRLAARAGISGPVQSRAAADAAWAAVQDGERIGPGAWVRTSDRGRARLAVEGIVLDVAPSSIVRLAEALALPGAALEPRAGFDLFVGSARLDVPAGSARLSAGEVAVEAVGPARLLASAGADGALRVEAVAGSADLRAANATRTLRAGEVATLRTSGAMTVEAAPPPISLLSPDDGERISGDVIAFAWSAAAPASGGSPASAYRFRLLDGDDVVIDRRVEGRSLEVSGAPRGTFHWTVAPILAGGYEGAAPAARVFHVGAAPPPLSVERAAAAGGRLVLAGRTQAGADVRVGGAQADVDTDGTWRAEVPAVDGIHAVGIVAEVAGGRSAAVALVAAGPFVEIDGIPATREAEIPLRLHVPEGGRIEIVRGAVAGDSVALSPGRNVIRVLLSVDEARAEAEAVLLHDREGPRILAVEASPGVVRPGDPVSIRVEAADDLSGPAPTALIEVAGPNRIWTVEVAGIDGIYETIVETGARERGVLRIRGVAVKDRLGNASTLEADATLVGGGGEEIQTAWAVLILGVGIAVGTAL